MINELQLANKKFTPFLIAANSLEYSTVLYQGFDTDGYCVAIEANGTPPFLLIAELTKSIFCNVLDKDDTTLSLQSLFSFTYTKEDGDLLVFPSIRINPLS